MKNSTLCHSSLSPLPYLLILSSLLFYVMPTFSQSECGMNEQMVQRQPNLFCGSNNIVDYIPQLNDNVKTVDIVVNVMQKESPNDPQNFSNTSTHIAAIRSFLFNHTSEVANKHPFRALQVKAYDGTEYPNDPYINDGKIQIRIIEINFIQDNTGWNNNNEECGTYNFDRYKGQGDKTDIALMVYLVEGIVVGSPPHLWGLGGCGPSNFIILNGCYKSYLENGENSESYTAHWLIIRELAAHEMGHSIASLSHTFSGIPPNCSTTSCNFDDIVPCPTWCGWCDPYTNNTSTPICSNNIMSYAAIKRYFSPKQLGSFHRNLTRSDFARFVYHTANSPASDLYINSSQTWTVDRYVYGDVYIQPGATLTINCEVLMPPKSRIIVKQGARLIVDCGKLSTNRMPINDYQQYSNGDYWTGIEVWGNSSVQQTVQMRNPSYVQQLTDPGIVLISNSEISNARPAISTVQRGAYSWDIKKTNFGGLIYATNTTFSNNYRTAAFLNYDFTNYSAFIDCIFNNTPVGASCVTIWETDGIEFKDCDFTNITKAGILAYDATIKVTGSGFNAVHHGVENYSSYTMSSNLTVGPTTTGEVKNTFEGCDVGVFITATSLAKIVDNDFKNGFVGIYATGECEYDIKLNDFLSCQTGLQNYQTLNSGNNRARCNIFDHNDVGIFYQGDNGGARTLYNEFIFDAAGQSFNVQVTYATDLTHYYTGKIRNPQMNEDGTNGDLTSGNLFALNPTPSKRQIVAPTSQTSIFNYHVSNRTFNERVYPICGMNPEITCPQNNPANQNFEYTSYQNVNHNSGYCGTIPPIPCNDVSCYATIKSTYDQAVITYQNSPTQTNLKNLAIARTRKYEALRNLLIELQRVKDYNSYLTIVNAEQNDFGKRAKLWYYIDRKDWSGGHQYLNGFVINGDNDQAFVDVENINITRLEQGYDYVLSTNNINSLKSIANSSLPDRAYARAVLSQMIDTLYEPEIIEGIDPRSIESNELPSDNLVRIWPNPAFDLVNIDLGKLWNRDELYSVSLSTVTGNEVLKSTLNNSHTEIDISKIPTGFYLIQIGYKGKIIAVEKLIKGL